MATYKQVDAVTESKQRGGKREGAGGKPKYGEKTAVIRLPVSLVEKINSGLIDVVTLSKAKDSVTESNDKALKKEVEILQIKNENLTRDIASMNQRNSELSAELRTAKASLANQKPMINSLQKQIDNLTQSLQALKAENIKLLNVDDKTFSFAYSGNDWTIRKQQGRWHYQKETGRYAIAPEFIQIAPISNDNGRWFIELDSDKILMTVSGQFQE